MNSSQHKYGQGPGRARLRTIRSGLIAAALALMPAWAWGGGASRIDRPEIADLGGDETIGTLPMLSGGQPTLEIHRSWRGVHPTFYLEGRVNDLFDAIFQMQGVGSIGVEVLDPVSMRLRFVFEGDVQVTLDRMAVHSGAITAGLLVPRAVGSGQMTVLAGARPPLLARIGPGFKPLPLRALESGGVLDAGVFEILTTTHAGARSVHSIQTTPDVLVLSQSY